MSSITKTSEKRFIKKPWGQEEIWALNELYCGKILTVNAKQELSLQYHERKCETLYVLSGVGWIQIGDKRTRVVGGDCVEVRPGTKHTIKASSIMLVLEVSTPELNDVVRLQDRYGRAKRD